MTTHPNASNRRPARARRHGLRRSLALAAAAVFAFTANAAAAPAGGHHTPSGAATDATGSALPQLTRLLQAQADAWNRGDGAAFAATFAEDAEFVTFDGTHLRGLPEMARNFQYYFDHYTHGTRLVFTRIPVTLRFPAPRTAVMITTGCIADPGQAECRPDSRSIQTFVAVRRGGCWVLVSFQNTRVQGLLPPPGG
ncbi:SgcJ/EcaC family oxidoreductase [Yinghuangia seranimata]|uniref:SgcJ/EcaC family oxidoreductase n=1 Tax=Yinghuangia seranimata TaxID=408067 RepID=UPI00248BEEB4|nr:SgcJ/EcaC family oxidoreductase [Yinghuangia seranimata]MDI2126475.1 SgcJ/EcaC family oxidoreductase [Yinghuangia seranimata]